MNCYKAKAGELNQQWYVIDATEAVVGRLAAQIAPILMGKHRPTYTPYIDTGDFVVVTNVDKVVFTGKKWQQKFYQRYSGHPGGQKEEQAAKLFQRFPDRILRLAIQRMMPKNKIGRHMMSKLKLVSGSVHDHQAQKPIPLAAIDGRPTAAGGLFAPEKVGKVRKARTSTVAAPVEHEPAALPSPADVTAPPVATGEPMAQPSGEPMAQPSGEPIGQPSGETTPGAIGEPTAE